MSYKIGSFNCLNPGMVASKDTRKFADIIINEGFDIVTQHIKKLIKVEYNNVEADSSGKKLYLSGNSYDNDDVDLEKLFEMIKVFAELANSYKEAGADSLATRIKGRIFNS